MAMTVATESTFSVSNPLHCHGDSGGRALQKPRTYDVMPDGRILGVGTPGQTQPGAGPAQIHVVLNWLEELKQRVPTR